MQSDEYIEGLKKLEAKIDKNSSVMDENFKNCQHKMFIEEADLDVLYKQTFDAIQDEQSALEKVELIDYWNLENERRNQTR